MRKILLFLLIELMSFPLVNASDFYSIGNDAKVCAYRFDGKSYILLSFKDDEDDMRLVNNPIMKFKISDGTIIRLSGEEGSKESKQSGYMWGFGVMTGKTNDTHYALFYISSEEIEKLKMGIEKIAINTIPDVYIKTFKNDKIGTSLYNDFMTSSEDF